MTGRTLEMWLDFGCPWSRFALAELSLGLANAPRDLDVRLRAHRLDPAAPADYGRTTIEHLCADLDIGPEAAERMLDRVRDAGAPLGIGFNFAVARGGSTFDAHRLLVLAHDYGLQLALATSLFRTHFEDGLLLSDFATLRALAHDAGLPAQPVEALLASDAHADGVLTAEAEVRAAGITTRPAFRLAGQWLPVDWQPHVLTD